MSSELCLFLFLGVSFDIKTDLTRAITNPTNDKRNAITVNSSGAFRKTQRTKRTTRGPHHLKNIGIGYSDDFFFFCLAMIEALTLGVTL